jgi:phage-related protein
MQRKGARFTLICIRKNANRTNAIAKTSVVFYQEDPKNVPVLKWLDRLPLNVQHKYRVRIERLGDLGHELRRPEADYLRDGIYELRRIYRDELSHSLLLFMGKLPPCCLTV